jgi:hypothetical protein
MHREQQRVDPRLVRRGDRLDAPRVVEMAHLPPGRSVGELTAPLSILEVLQC